MDLFFCACHAINKFDRVYPEWRVNSEFITEHLTRALSLDSKLSSHPIEVECPDANHINQVSVPGCRSTTRNSTLVQRSSMPCLILKLRPVISQIIFHVVLCPDSYTFLVLRMLSYYVGEEKFLQGVSNYLKKKLFANSVTHDLWDGISAATGINITELMENWITKIGFPVVSVTENENGITVRQDRFLETGVADPKDNETIW